MENKNIMKKEEVEKKYKYLIGKNVQKTENSVYKITDVKYRIHPNFEYLELQYFYIYYNETNKEILINSNDWEPRNIESISPYLENLFISDEEFNEVLDKAIKAAKEEQEPNKFKYIDCKVMHESELTNYSNIITV